MTGGVRSPFTAPSEDEFVFNGVDPDTGSYLFPRMRLDTMGKAIRGESLDRAYVADLRARHEADSGDHLGVVFGRHPELLHEVGWALVAADDVGADVLAALEPLSKRRRDQAGDLYREFTGPMDGVHPMESSQDFLIRHNVPPMDVVDPRRLPYYVLLVGSPDRISFAFQYQLDVQFAVGRVHFSTAEQYGQYAENVVGAERQSVDSAGSRAYVFAPRNSGDFPTALSASRLAEPLVADLKGRAQVGFDIGGSATKERLAELLSGEQHTDLLFTASHGLGTAGPRQRDLQGALLCQDWRGPAQGLGALTGEEYFAAADLDSGHPVTATVVFSFACYGAGTPHVTDFIDAPTPAASADPPFIARLPQRLLSHPRGGCLAFVGHVDRAWNCSFLWKGPDPQIISFSSSVEAFLSGAPLGMAMEYVNQRHASAATELVSLLQSIRTAGRIVDDRELARLWLATNDARNFIIVGDPAIRSKPSAVSPAVV